MPTWLRYFVAPLGCALLVVACGGDNKLDGPDPAPADAPKIGSEVVLAKDGYELPYRRWGPEVAESRAVVLGLHGLNDYSVALAPIANHLAAFDITTYAYDQRGFGATRGAGGWAGTEQLIDDAATLVELLTERYPQQPLWVLGQSMGGAVAIRLAVERKPSAVTGLILEAPAVWARHEMPWYQRTALWLTSHLAPGARFSSEIVDVQPTDDPQLLAQMEDDPLIQHSSRADTLAGVSDLMGQALNSVSSLTLPSLILYGENDEIIPPQAICAFLERLPQRPPGQWRAALYPEGYHMLTRDLQREQVHADIAAWINNPNAPTLPSGREIDRRAGITQLCSR